MTRVLDQLEAMSPPRRSRFERWVAREPVLVGLHPKDLRGFLLDNTEPVGFDRRDAVLAALIRLARIDAQAGQLLIVCLLPGVRAKLRRHATGMDPAEAAAVMVGAHWRRICCYSLDRRPHKIALNLLLDASHDLIVARERERSWEQNRRLIEDGEDLDQRAPDLGTHLISSGTPLHGPRC
jgi:hypothetical protein